jgi:hypothetical protein
MWASGAGALEGAVTGMADDIEWIEQGDGTSADTCRRNDEATRHFMTTRRRIVP